MVHCHAPLLVHFQFLSEGTNGSFPTGYQLFQILVPQFFPGPTLSCTLSAPLEFGLQVDFGWLSTAFARLLHFASNHLTVIHLGRQAGPVGRSLPRPSLCSAGLARPGPAPGEEGDMVLTAPFSRLTVPFPDATVTGMRDQFRNGRADPGGGPERLPSPPPPPPPPP